MPARPKSLTPWQQHQIKWSNCEKCDLCQYRTQVVLFRGSVKAAVLFIGESPGVAEDTIGQPSVGPAGQLLDDIIQRAKEIANTPTIKLGFTNLISCIPKDESHHKLHEPPKKAIMACSERLLDIFNTVKPQKVVCVGKLSTKWTPQFLPISSIVSIPHPAAVLRAHVTQQGLQIQRCVTILTDLFEELI